MVVARAALHFWEEPVISGERGSGTVFFTRCPLGCVYCQNAAIASADLGVAVTPERLAEAFLSLQEQGALNVNCVTPTHHSPGIMQAVRIARDGGLAIPVVWNTSGYERSETIRALSGTVDVYLTDFKYADGETAQALSHVQDYPETALCALREMVETVGVPSFDEVDGAPRMVRGVIVRHMMLPGRLEESKRAVHMLFAEFGDSVLYSLMNQYTPLLATRAREGDASAASALAAYPELAERVPDDDYSRLLDFADSLGMEDYFWQEGPAAEESFIPIWDGTGVECA